ncbi:hypothetical protein CYMTET_40248, partial [Cymbomonas tetramitiformis]
MECGPCPAGYVGTGFHGCRDIDECATADRGGCATQARCINLAGGVTCGPCEPSELYLGDGRECRRSTTCGEENGGCDPLSECLPTAGQQVRCGGCPHGMSGTGATKCVEIDGCASSPCFEGVECADVPAPGLGAGCGRCPDGYAGDGRTCEPERCLLEPYPCSMDPPVACSTIQGGGYTCGSCPEGYLGDGVSCRDVDECAVQNGGCDSLSQCINQPGGRSCGSCPEGYLGSGDSKCRQRTPSCVLANGGCDLLATCTDTEAGAECGACPEGYDGDGVTSCTTATEDESRCGPSACYPGVRCEAALAPAVGEERSVGALSPEPYRCGACPVGFVGDGISCTVDRCFWRNGGCDPAVSCFNDAASPSGRVCGACPIGFVDTSTELDVTRCEDADGCLAAPCLPERECVDVAAAEEAALGVAFSCGPCPDGYALVGDRCQDLDECAQAPNGLCWEAPDGSARSECVNLPGGYACGSCPSDMRGSGAAGCVPVTNCSVDNGGCWADAPCAETASGSECGACPLHFEGDGHIGCTEGDGCVPGSCFPGVECMDVRAPGVGYTCGACPEGYWGDGRECTLCRMRVGIEYTTAVDGAVKRAGWHRAEYEVIGGLNEGLDSSECVNHLGTRFWWSGASSDGSVLVLDADKNKADTLTLNLPKADLTVGISYTFRLSASLWGNREVTATATTTFFVKSMPLVLTVRGGDLTTGEASPITLDASDSVDPDGAPGAIVFTWRCSSEAPAAGGCRYPNGTALPALMHGAEVTLRLAGPDGDTGERNYRFALSGTKGGRRTDLQTWVSIISGGPPVPSITPILDSVNPQELLRLRGSASAIDPASLEYEWTAIEERSTQALELTTGAGGTLSSASRFTSSLTVRRRVLEGGGEYTLQLAARDSTGTGAARITVRINTPPVGGWAAASPGTGRAYSDPFVLSAPGWTDEDVPLWYQFACQVAGPTAAPVVLQDFVPRPGPVTTLMPVEGLELHDHKVVVLITIRDSLGATATAFVDIAAPPPDGGANVSGVNVSARVARLTESAAEDLRNGKTEAALVQVEAATSNLLGASEATTQPSQYQELLRLVAGVKAATASTYSAVERLAGTLRRVTLRPEALGAAAEAQAMTLLRGLVEDTTATPLEAPLSAGAAQAICDGLAALSHKRERTRAEEVAEVMAQMARSMVYEATTGEEGAEVMGKGLAMKVMRGMASDVRSTLYTAPMITAGAAVSFPETLASLAMALAATDTSPPCSRSASQEDCGGRHTDAVQMEVDARVMASEADPHSVSPDPHASAVITITLSDPETGAEVTVRELSEAITFTLELQASSTGPTAMPWNSVRCTFWNVTDEKYSTTGCTQFPNPAPAGAVLRWRSRELAALPAGLESAWVLGDNNLTHLTEGCIESFDATWPEYAGMDAGLRKYLPVNPAPAGGGAQPVDASGEPAVEGGCELARRGNRFGCWWNWTHQIFTGPACLRANQQQCYCTHLTDFQAKEAEVGSLEPPKIKSVSTKQLGSVSVQDVRESTVLLMLVWGIMGTAAYLAWLSAFYHNEERRALLNAMALRRGTGRLSFRAVSGVWSWSLLEEDRTGHVHRSSMKQMRVQRQQAIEQNMRLLTKANKLYDVGKLQLTATDANAMDGEGLVVGADVGMDAGDFPKETRPEHRWGLMQGILNGSLRAWTGRRVLLRHPQGAGLSPTRRLLPVPTAAARLSRAAGAALPKRVLGSAEQPGAAQSPRCTTQAPQEADAGESSRTDAASGDSQEVPPEETARERLGLGSPTGSPVVEGQGLGVVGATAGMTPSLRERHALLATGSASHRMVATQVDQGAACNPKLASPLVTAGCVLENFQPKEDQGPTLPTESSRRPPQQSALGLPPGAGEELEAQDSIQDIPQATAHLPASSAVVHFSGSNGEESQPGFKEPEISIRIMPPSAATSAPIRHPRRKKKAPSKKASHPSDPARRVMEPGASLALGLGSIWAPSGPHQGRRGAGSDPMVMTSAYIPTDGKKIPALPFQQLLTDMALWERSADAQVDSPQNPTVQLGGPSDSKWDSRGATSPGRPNLPGASPDARPLLRSLSMHPDRRKRLCVRLKAACLMVRILQETQDLSTSRYMCRLMNVDLHAMQLRIPATALRLMTDEALGAQVPELTGETNQRTSALSRLAQC